MPAIDPSTFPSVTDVEDLLPSSRLRTVVVVTICSLSLLFAAYTASPTQLMKHLLKTLGATDEIYSRAFGETLHDLSRTNASDRALALRFMDLRDTATALHVRILEHGTSPTRWWWNELCSCCKGLSFKILRCTSHLECLGNEIQLRAHQRANDLTAEFASGNSALGDTDVNFLESGDLQGH
ncbi:hypothetical protein C8R43DRAFT_1144254 [Mycena crocata]|nr:hypothetical protein C8R43DRAFT_1144254 [Mycena crocata]